MTEKALFTDEQKADIGKIENSRNAIGCLIKTLKKDDFKDLRLVLYLLNHPSVTILENDELKKGELKKDDIKDAIKYLDFVLFVLNQLVRNTQENTQEDNELKSAIRNISCVLDILDEILKEIERDEHTH